MGVVYEKTSFGLTVLLNILQSETGWFLSRSFAVNKVMKNCAL